MSRVFGRVEFGVVRIKPRAARIIRGGRPLLEDRGATYPASSPEKCLLSLSTAPELLHNEPTVER